jgi:hypothetical protein
LASKLNEKEQESFAYIFDSVRKTTLCPLV